MFCLRGKISLLYLFTGFDKWRFKLSSDGFFYVSNLRDLIDSIFIVPISNPTMYYHLAPLKVIGFIWCASMDRIPTAMTLLRRGISQISSLCHLYSNGLDEKYHFLARCHFLRRH